MARATIFLIPLLAASPTTTSIVPANRATPGAAVAPCGNRSFPYPRNGV
jgi:hypothetical protein